MRSTLIKALVVTCGLATANLAIAARDYISVVGSSTVYPFTTVVAERFGRSTGLSTPKVESTGTGGGMKLFCAGLGETTADMTNASRAIKDSELELCASNGVNNVIEMKVGYDGIVFANSRQADAYSFTRQQIFLGLAKYVPNADGMWIENPYMTWNEISPELPATKIEVLGPPPTSGTRDAFVELVMEVGAESIASLEHLAAAASADEMKAQAEKMGLAEMYAELGEDLVQVLSQSMREDGAFIEAGENDNLIVQKLNANPAAFGIFGYSFLEENADTIQGSAVEGVEPTFEAIADGSYSVSRPLFVYVKGEHVGVIPGMKEFLQEYTSEKAWGDEGYLTDKGLIPMPRAERTEYKAAVEAAF